MNESTAANLAPFRFLAEPVATKWTDLLPAPFNTDPEVVIGLFPKGGTVKVVETENGDRVGIFTIRDKTAGIQMIQPEAEDWVEQEIELEKRGLQMFSPEYIGKLSECPKRFFLTTVRHPLVFLKDQPSAEFLNLKHYFHSITKTENNAN